VSSNRKVPRSLVCTFPLVPLAGSAYAATSRITLPQAPTSDVALPLNLPESQKRLQSREDEAALAKRVFQHEGEV